MSAGASAVTAGAAAAIIQATKALGVIVRVEAAEFLYLVGRNEEPLIVHAPGGFFGTKHKYLPSYRGLAFLTTSDIPISLPSHCEVVEAQKIWIPG